MRYSLNELKSLNLNPREEPDDFRLMIEMLPNEVAALRLGADPEPAYLRIKQLLSESKLTEKGRKEGAEHAGRPL